MAQLARAAANDPAFVAFARGLGSIGSLDAWVRETFIYRDESEEIVRTPQFMLADMGRMDNGRVVRLEGDCDDISTFYCAACSALGHRARFVAIRFRQETLNFEHVYAQAYDGGRWLTLDATVRPGTPIKSLEELTEYV